MERWTEAFPGKIPKDMYSCELENGEMNGLIIRLSSKKYRITIDFGNILGLRIFDEGCLLGDWPPLKVVKETGHFRNTIYLIKNGGLEATIREASGNLYDDMELLHYAIITMNYIIDVVSRWEPEITVKFTRSEEFDE